jgi:hypothetical protein
MWRTGYNRHQAASGAARAGAGRDCGVPQGLGPQRAGRGVPRNRADRARGQRFAGADVHERIVGSHVDGAPMETLYPSALDDMADGVETCDDIECEWCHDELALSDE